MNKVSEVGILNKVSKIIMRKMIKNIIENMGNMHEEMGHFSRGTKMLEGYK